MNPGLRGQPACDNEKEDGLHGISTVSLAAAICWPSVSRATTRIM